MLKRTPNLLFDHLTRRRWPSESQAAALLLILVFGGSSCVAISVAALKEMPSINFALPLIAVALTSLLIALVSPFISAAVTAIGTVQMASDETLMMLKLTDLPPEAIVQGMLMAALYRLRLLWVLCYGLLVPLWVMLYSVLAEPFSLGDESAIAFWIVLCAALLGTGANWLAVSSAVAAGLAWRKVGPAVGTSFGVALAEMIVLAGALYVAARMEETTRWSGDLISPVYVWLIAVALLYGAVGVIVTLSTRKVL